MFIYDKEVPPVKDWLAIAYSVYKEYSFKIFDLDFTIILSKRK